MDHDLPLMLEANVRAVDHGWLAMTPEAWLVAPGLERLAGGWFAVSYAQGRLDEAIRPLIRFRLAGGGEQRVPLNAAPFGRARWIGRMPTGTVEVAFCSVRRPGLFEFRLLGARRVSRLRLLARGLAREPALALTALGARLIGAREEARHCLAFAATATSPRHYPRWRRQGSEQSADEAPRMPDGPTFHLLVRHGAPEALARTQASLAASPFPHWRVWTPENGADAALTVREVGRREDWVAVLDAGDQVTPLAFAQIAAAAARDPSMLAMVGDEEVGGIFRPRPDWSPLDGETGRGMFVRLSALPPDARLGHLARQALLADGIAPDRVIALYRPLWRRERREPTPAPPLPPLPEAPLVTVVVPFRDRPALLAACLHGLDRTTGRLEIVLVDNGSTHPAAIRLGDEAAVRPGTILLRRPGPFNYAALCNEGAATGTAPHILFLNNDVEPRDPDWLRRLAAQAVRPEVGAVGAQLLFPNGRLQHGGVTVGLGGTALHLGRGGRDRPDPLGLLGRPRRVGAVTGAVLMVERAKFEAVGGFDAEAFPILLNDIDLCLRLAARGWQTLYEPRATLIHRESASRGRDVRPLARHAAERARFAARWADAIRHDPGFHPALSLWSIPPALG